MKTAYALPAFSAAALHVLFFFGFDSPAPSHSAQTVVVGEPEVPSMVIPLRPYEPPAEIEDRMTVADQSDPVDITDIAPDSSIDDRPDRPGPESIPAIQPERVVLNTEGFRQDPQSYRSGSGDFAGGAKQRFGDVFASGALDRIPDARLRVPPRYPDAMRRAGMEASVEVTFVVDVDGRVVEARADERAVREFAEAAEQAVRRWRFEPGTRRGKPVSFRMSVPLVFSITD